MSLHPASSTAEHVGSSIDNGVSLGFLVGDLKSALEELRTKGVTIHRDIVEKDVGKNAVILDPDQYMISLFEPIYEDKDQQTSGYHGTVNPLTSYPTEECFTYNKNYFLPERIV